MTASLLEPGAHRAPDLDDAALVRAMPHVEVAWPHAGTDAAGDPASHLGCAGASVDAVLRRAAGEDTSSG